MTKKIIITGCAVQRSRRCVELFADNRFKPRIVKQKTVYSRKGRPHKEKGDA